MYIPAFLAGVFICNALPHLAAGLRGEIFPTPFARPRGKGPSSPLVNFLWGMFNLLVGLVLLSRQPVTIGDDPAFIALMAGALAIGTYLSIHFGKQRRPSAPD
ncbi:hypothetical protein CCU68_10365 [Pseudomonas gingeri NCPPB 3146 = LMG 5327]|uniref:Uncharacterized protein n=2 Tax=Pseudomonas gingeri TaxID=117681 RepID=A0A7Y7XXN5_9PSED|nr:MULTISPECIES: hypothetical protein [Pseudomonas]NWC13253.1 hypothetical protein [Pseudomonas gingeri]PNQ92699.1 hypothetical protein CCU68_10365 [Pseudomonas gingeri NCPPB 3146 = LMG 5327]BBP77379.1 hypothetical protein PHLH7_34830 [Pseudomonas sp. Ost2]